MNAPPERPPLEEWLEQTRMPWAGRQHPDKLLAGIRYALHLERERDEAREWARCVRRKLRDPADWDVDVGEFDALPWAKE